MKIEGVDTIPLPISEACDCNHDFLIYTSFLKVGKYWSFLNKIQNPWPPAKGVIIDGKERIYYWRWTDYLLETKTKKEINAMFSTSIKRNKERAKKPKRKKVVTEWSKHLEAFRAKHPKLSFKDCMEQASKTYKKKPVGKRALKKTNGN